MHLKRAWLAIGLLSVWLLVGPAAATMVKSVTLEESIDASRAIVTGTVVGERVIRLADGRHLTRVTIRVEEGLKGPFGEGDRITVHALGGEYRGQRQLVLGEASYRKGERVLLQLERIDGRLHTLGLALGKWNLVGDPGDRQVLVRNLAGLAIAGGRAAVTEGPLELDEFRGLVLARSPEARWERRP